MSVPPEDQKILGKTATESWAARREVARQAIEGFDPRTVVIDAATFEQAARCMFDLTLANSPYATDISWEAYGGSKDVYFASVRCAAEEVLGLRQPEDFRGFVSGWCAHASGDWLQPDDISHT